MSSVRTLKRRIRSVQATQQITRAMEMVAAAKLMRARRDVEQARPYGATMAAMLGHLTGAAGQLEHPLFERRTRGRCVVVVFASDRGFCGAFNANVARATSGFVEEPRDEGVQLIFVGRKVWDTFRRRDHEILDVYRGIGTRVDLELARRITDRLLDVFLEGEVRSIHLLYTHFVSAIRRQIICEKLLNIEPPESAAGKGEEAAAALDYIFEPTPQRIFADLLPRYALTRVVTAFLDSFASEHSARMVAMGSATKNAEEMIDQLVLLRNRLRQAIITKEIAELVGGAEALA